MGWGPIHCVVKWDSFTDTVDRSLAELAAHYATITHQLKQLCPV